MRERSLYPSIHPLAHLAPRKTTLSVLLSNNTLRTHLSSQTPSIPPTLIDTIIDDPTALWRPTALYGAQVFDLPAEEKATIVRAYVAGFRAMFRVFVGLMGVNLYVRRDTDGLGGGLTFGLGHTR